MKTSKTKLTQGTLAKDSYLSEQDKPCNRAARRAQAAILRSLRHSLVHNEKSDWTASQREAQNRVKCLWNKI